MADDVEEDNELHSKEHGTGARELHRSEDAHFSARRYEEDLKQRELLRKTERAPPTPTQPNGSRKVLSPDSVFFPPESPLLPNPRGEASKTTKTRWPSSGPRKTHDKALFTAGVSLPLADLPSLPNGTPVSTPTPLEGIARTHQVSFRLLFEVFCSAIPRRRWEGRKYLTLEKAPE